MKLMMIMRRRRKRRKTWMMIEKEEKDDDDGDDDDDGELMRLRNFGCIFYGNASNSYAFYWFPDKSYISILRKEGNMIFVWQPAIYPCLTIVF
jgi:hypothetical protein